MSYKEFRKEQEDLQIKWRENQNNISKELGSQKDKKFPYIVLKEEWLETVWDDLRCYLSSYLKAEKRPRHSGSHNLLSSWILCSNLYFGTRNNSNQRELFKNFLENKLGIKIDKIDDIHLEFVLPGKLSPKKLLGEPGRTGQTTPDLAIEFTSYEKKGLILVESKYTEHNFYVCSAKKEGENWKECIKKELMNKIKKCFIQEEWNRKYWEYLDISNYGLNKLKCCPAFTGGYQIVRQQALAEGILKSKEYENVWSCIAYDGRNENLMKCMKRIGINSIEDEWEKIFNLKTKFSIWKHQEWVEYVEKNGKGLFEKKWVKYIKDRYHL
jgi:hypothetical protein